MEIEKYKTKPVILQDIVKQIQKDLNWPIEEVELGDDTQSAYQHLLKWLISGVTIMLNNAPNQFLSLLYRIDVKEEAVKRVLFNQNELNVSEELSKMILERECLKVVSRHLFSKGKDIEGIKV